jgi:hypothetical protein
VIARPQRVHVATAYDGSLREYQMQRYVTTTEKRGPREIATPPLEPVLRRRLGPDLFVDYAYS